MKRIADAVICEVVDRPTAKSIMGRDTAVYIHDMDGVYEHKGRKYFYRITNHGIHYFTEFKLDDNQFILDLEV